MAQAPSTPTRPDDASPGADAGAHPGARLGLPADGPGSMARLGPRVLALLIDWIVCTLIAVALLRMPYPPHGEESFKPLLVLLVECALLVGTGGATLGHRVLGLRVVGEHGNRLGLAGATLRALLLVLVIPPMVWDRDGRGLHDRLARSVIVRAR